MNHTNYADLQRFSNSTGIPPEKLVEAFEIEKVFHERILKEESFEKRQEMYLNVYNTVHPIYGTTKTDIQHGRNPADKMVRLFRKELEGKSILDTGCGVGYFLASVSRLLKHERLVGIDVSIPPLSKHHQDIEFISANIVKFDIKSQFDVVYSSQVLEHIAPADLPLHLASVRSALKSKGLFIVSMPNRLFGPHDVTRCIDCSYMGKTKAQGTHLNESTYGDMVSLLEDNGFENPRTVFTIPGLKTLFRGFRMRPSVLQTIENSPYILKALHSIKRRGESIWKMGITLICHKC
jgi:2-polyprenyl-3-methyl-5-hydroxy-6-metoxy-1,4-benzoquinol methylase